MRTRNWNDSTLRDAVKKSFSIRQVIKEIGLIPAGGNYIQIKKRISELSIDTNHFTGQLWSKGKKISRLPVYSLDEILVENSTFQSHKLKKRLFHAGLKKEQCETCGWSKRSVDGRIPLELDHVNGNRFDNRISNIRILCPNCHSLQPTHRGRNIGNAGVV